VDIPAILPHSGHVDPSRVLGYGVVLWISLFLLSQNRDYIFKFRVEQTMQFAIFYDERNATAVDEPIMHQPLLHF
jgi:hypothetical protein